MELIFGIICLFVGGFMFKDSWINNKRLLEEFKEMESDLGISYYKGWIAAIGFIILGILLVIDFFNP